MLPLPPLPWPGGTTRCGSTSPTSCRVLATGRRLAEGADSVWFRRNSYCYRARVRGLRDETSDALDDFNNALHRQRELEKEPARPLYGACGCWHALLLARLGQNEKATRLPVVGLLEAGELPRAE